VTTPLPTCWNCGYELSGLRVEGHCPECGTPIWSQGGPALQANGDASAALVWGVVSLVLFFTCLGPLAGFVAIPAITKGGRYQAEVRAGRALPNGSAKAGLICGWIAAGLSIGVVALYGIAIAFSLVVP